MKEKSISSKHPNEREKYLFTRYKSIASGTNLAEYLTGGFTAIFILFA